MVTDLDMVMEASIACVDVRSESKQESHQHNETCEILKGQLAMETRGLAD